jgi:hypothetical protein
MMSSQVQEGSPFGYETIALSLRPGIGLVQYGGAPPELDEIESPVQATMDARLGGDVSEGLNEMPRFAANELHALDACCSSWAVCSTL